MPWGYGRGTGAVGITYSDEYRATLIRGWYSTYLNRLPGPTGAAGWLSAMRSGVTIQQMEAGFIGSEEYYAKAGGTDAGWVVQLYNMSWAEQVQTPRSKRGPLPASSPVASTARTNDG